MDLMGQEDKRAESVRRGRGPMLPEREGGDGRGGEREQRPHPCPSIGRTPPKCKDPAADSTRKGG